MDKFKSDIFITVHSFKKSDIYKGECIKSRRMGTEEAIKQLGGCVIPGTAVEVPESAVDRNGLTEIDYSPRA
jgi:hypothetical protein